MARASKRDVVAQEARYEALTAKFAAHAAAVERSHVDFESAGADFDDAVPSLWVNAGGDFDEDGKLLSSQAIEEAHAFLEQIEADLKGVQKLWAAVRAAEDALDARRGALRNLIAKMHAYSGGISADN